MAFKGDKMPFSSLHNPDDLARAGRFLGAAWAKIEEHGLLSGDAESERIRLAHVVAGLLKSDADDADLIDAAITRFLQPKQGIRSGVD